LSIAAAKLPESRVKVKFIVQSAVSAVVVCFSNAALGAEASYPKLIENVAREIAGLKNDFPQLRGFSSIDNVDIDNLRISYAYHTHEPERTGGWTSGVPHPDADGIWFDIDLHDARSTAEMHTQPISASMCLGDKKVMFLILEGADTRSANAALWKILRRNGAHECRR
jgi:hypothetical protein